MEVKGIGSNDIYTFQLPDPPALKRIHGYGKHVSDQYWKREEWYDYTDDDYYHLSDEQQTEIAEIEHTRCTEGVWLFNNGNLLYLTGDNYFFLAHWVMDNGERPKIVYNQILDFYFYSFCEDDDKCFGSIEMKPRQEGCTQRKLAIYVNRAIRTRNKKFGIQSKTGDDAKKVNFGNLQLGFNGIPHFMKPRLKATGVASEMAFAAPSEKNTNKKNKAVFDFEAEKDKKRYLDTVIDWKSTSVKGYDGKHLYRYIQDEYFKWEQANAYEAWFTVKRALGDDFQRWGKAFLLSTVGVDDEEEKVSEEAILNGVKLWNESNYTERTSLGFTTTGLYRWFIPAWASKIGTSPFDPRKQLCDKYGNVDELEVKKVLFEKLKNARDGHERMIIMRQDPMTPQDALRSLKGTKTAFSNIQERLEGRLDYLKMFEPTPQRPVKYRIGNLHWVNNERFGKVVFRDDEENGRFKIAYLPDVAGAQMANRYKIIGDRLLAPYSDSPFLIGLDPVEFEKVQYGDGSKAAFHVFLKHNVANPNLSNVYCAQYFARPDIAILCEDVYKAIIYFGAKINIERQMSSILFKGIKDNGLKAFLMRRPDAVKWNRRTSRDDDFGTPTSPRSIQIGFEAIENRFSLPNPETNENLKDELEYFWFDETLEQLIECDPKDMKKFDLVSAMCQTEIAAQTEKRFSTLREEPTSNGLSMIDYLAPIHKGNGVISHRDYNEQKKQPIRFF